MIIVFTGKNVLYVSLEIDERQIYDRADANLLDLETKQLKTISRKDYGSRLKRIQGKEKGRLFVKQFPTAGANVNHIRALMDELELKHDFTPDVLCIDYLNIMAGLRYNNMGDTYNYVKAIIEEIRGLAVEKDLCVITANTKYKGSQSE